MGKLIGPASDFYRLRLTHLDMTEEPDFDWRDDVLWREHAPEPLEEHDVWIAEVVDVATGALAARLEGFDDPDEAREFLSEVEEDLVELTKSQFEAAWLEPAADDPGADTD